MARSRNIEAIISDYVESVLTGRLPSCKMIIAACQRYQDDWSRDDLYFDWVPVKRFCAFAASLKHFKGELAGQYIELEPWQIFIAANILGWTPEAIKFNIPPSFSTCWKSNHACSAIEFVKFSI